MFKIICVSLVSISLSITSLEKISSQIDKKYFSLITTTDESPLKTYIAIVEKDKVLFIRDTKTLVFNKTQIVLYIKDKLYIYTSTHKYIFKKL